MTKYPKLGEYRKPKQHSGRRCAVCGAVAAGIQFVEITFLRGDDLDVAACDTCRKTRKEDVIRMAELNEQTRQFAKVTRAQRQGEL